MLVKEFFSWSTNNRTNKTVTLSKKFF